MRCRRHRLIVVRRFNPRAPGGARSVEDRTAGLGLGEVSIHAPPEGRDRAAAELNAEKSSFNPRAPGGARSGPPLPVLYEIQVSIHAPPEGRDRGLLGRLNNPRSPGGARCGRS